MLSSSEPSMMRQRFARALREYGVPGLNSQKKLTAHQTQLLLERVSKDERKDILDTRSKCYDEALMSYGLPTATFGVSALLMFHIVRSRLYRGSYANNYALYPATICVSWVLRDEVAESKCKERIPPKIALLWQKYGDADSTTNNRIPSEEWANSLYEARIECMKEVVKTHVLPTAAFVFVSLIAAHKRLPAKFLDYDVLLLTKGWRKYPVLFSIAVMAGCMTFPYGYDTKLKEHWKPKVAGLLLKYCGDEVTTNYADLIKGSRGGAGAKFESSSITNWMKLTLNAEQIKQLLSRISEDERKELQITLNNCRGEIVLTRAIPFSALSLGALHVSRTWIPATLHVGPLWYAMAGFGSLMLAYGLGMENTCKDRVRTKIGELWLKYGGPEATASLLSMEQRRSFVRLLKKYGASGLDSQERLILNSEQIEHLLSRVSEEEMKYIQDSHWRCRVFAWIIGISCAIALFRGSLFVERTRLPAMLRFNAKGVPFYVSSCLGSLAFGVAARALGMNTLGKARVQPKIDHMWQKYGGDESTTNYETLSKRNRGGVEVPYIDPEIMPMPVTTEKRPNVDDTYAPRVRYPTHQRQGAFAYSDTLISGTPSGASRVRLEKSGNHTKTNSYGDVGFS